MGFQKFKKTDLFFSLFFVLTIPLFVIAVGKAKNLYTRASAKKADITINSQKTAMPFSQSWRGLGQGGEESSPGTLSAVVPHISDLHPKYIRVDHIFDFYDVVRRENGNYIYSFDKLDILVRDILKTGALPFFSLSYTPSIFTRDGVIVSQPYDYNLWSELIQKTVSHYSGSGGLNLADVYYEVWNEPDLFGRWDIGRGEKDYLTLYSFAARGAKSAPDTNKYYFGGPAITVFYPNWINTLLDYTAKQNLPLDFISWHFYGRNPLKLQDDLFHADEILSAYKNRKIQKIISEWGIDSDMNVLNDNNVSAAFTMAGLKQILDRTDYSFIFEIKDGLDPKGNTFWGRWGLLTHEQSGSIAKPRYNALKLLDKLEGLSLDFAGGGTFIDGWAVKKDSRIKVLLYNYDATNQNYEAVPVAITNLENGIYNIHQTSLTEPSETSDKTTISDNTFKKSIVMTANNVVLLEIEKVGLLVSFSQGRSSDSKDQSLELVEGSQLPVFNFSSSDQTVEGSVNLWFKPYWSGSSGDVNYPLFNLAGSGGQSLYSRFERKGFTNSLVFGFAISNQERDNWQTQIPIGNWTVNSWHNLRFNWSDDRLRVETDASASEVVLPLHLLPINDLVLAPGRGALDDLQVMVNGQAVVDKKFDGTVE